MSSETADGPVAARAQAEESMHAVGGAIMALNPFQEVRMAGLILGIDLGRSQSVFCWYDPATQTASFARVPSRPSEFRLRQAVIPVSDGRGDRSGGHVRLGARPVRRDEAALRGGQHQRRAVAVEACQAQDRPRHALKLAKLSASGDLPTITVPPPAVRQWCRSSIRAATPTVAGG